MENTPLARESVTGPSLTWGYEPRQNGEAGRSCTGMGNGPRPLRPVSLLVSLVCACVHVGVPLTLSFCLLSVFLLLTLLLLGALNP